MVRAVEDPETRGKIFAYQDRRKAATVNTGTYSNLGIKLITPKWVYKLRTNEFTRNWLTTGNTPSIATALASQLVELM